MREEIDGGILTDMKDGRGHTAERYCLRRRKRKPPMQRTRSIPQAVRKDGKGGDFVIVVDFVFVDVVDIVVVVVVIVVVVLAIRVFL